MQRAELANVALDAGAGTTDELNALVTDLADATAELEDKRSEQTELLVTLGEQRADGEALAAQYEEQYVAAKAELGDLIEQERERRAAAELAAAQQRERDRRAAQGAAQQQSRATPPRGGGAPAPVVAAPTRSPSPASSGSTGSGPVVTAPQIPAVTAPPAAPPATSPAPDPPAASDVPRPSSQASIAVGAAQSQLGVPYRFAAEAPGEAFDCSGLTKYAWGRAGVYLPHQSSQQYASTPHVPQELVQPGDLIFYYSPIGHVGIYVGGGSLIHATQPGDVVKVSKVSWNKVVGVSRPG